MPEIRLRPCPFCGGDRIDTPTTDSNGAPIPRCSSCLAEAPNAVAWNRRPAEDVKQAEDLIALGGKFYAVDGQSWCDTALDSWKLVPGVGFVKQD